MCVLIYLFQEAVQWVSPPWSEYNANIWLIAAAGELRYLDI